MANVKDLRTQFAGVAVALAARFDAVMGHLRLGPRGFRPTLSTPDGPSTGGGVQAMQHIRLVAQDDGTTGLMVGHVNPAQRSGEVRSYAYVAGQFRQRYKRPLDIDEADYARFVDALQTFFRIGGFTSTIADPPADPEPAAEALPAPVSASQTGAMLRGFALGVLVVAILAAGVAWWYLHRS